VLTFDDFSLEILERQIREMSTLPRPAGAHNGEVVLMMVGTDVFFEEELQVRHLVPSLFSNLDLGLDGDYVIST
jgi:hypothetical protein